MSTPSLQQRPTMLRASSTLGRVSPMSIVRISTLVASSIGFAFLLTSYKAMMESDWGQPTSRILAPNEKENEPSPPLPSSSSAEQFLPRIFAIYFPQFHPDPLNDRLWGSNFTDWDNLRKAPLTNKLGYRIPRPLSSSPLGYYDLRAKETRKIQSDLASRYGIDGFIYHTYWFYDPRFDPTEPQPVLHRSLMEMIKDGHPAQPFFLNWCAVTWVNVWMGRPLFQSKDAPINKNNALTLQKQYFNATDEMVQTHYQWLSQFFKLQNYVKIRGEPVFFVYQYTPEMNHILEKLRKCAIRDGYTGLYIIMGRGSPPEHVKDMKELVGFQLKKLQTLTLIPDGDLINQTITYPYPSEHFDNLSLPRWCQSVPVKHGRSAGYDTAKQNEYPPPYPQFGRNKPEIYALPVTFDNTPRREFKTANQWNYGDPDDVVQKFRTNLEILLTFDSCCWRSNMYSPQRTQIFGARSESLSGIGRDDQERFLVINAWNEWAEGMMLEPSDVFEYRFLETVRDVKKEVLENQCRGPFQLGNHS